LYGWHPAEEEQIFRLRVELQEGRQLLIRERLSALLKGEFYRTYALTNIV
jgi:hypothetical protein